MARVWYAMEKYRLATRILASKPERIHERLAAAVLDIMDCQNCVPVMENDGDVTRASHKLWRQLNAKKSPDGTPDVQACIKALTEEEACAVADAIVMLENKLREIYDSSG